MIPYEDYLKEAGLLKNAISEFAKVYRRPINPDFPKSEWITARLVITSSPEIDGVNAHSMPSALAHATVRTFAREVWEEPGFTDPDRAYVLSNMWLARVQITSITESMKGGEE